MQPSNFLLNLLKQIETKSLKPYLCSAGKATISYGVTHYENGQAVKLTDPEISEARCESLFMNTLKPYINTVNRTITRPLTQQQFDAFLMMCYNSGIGAFTRPCKVALYFNASDLAKVEEWWVKSFITSPNTGDKPVKGLINRRKCEWQMFKDGIYKRVG